MKGEIHVWVGIKGAQIGLNKSTNITTFTLKVFKSLEEILKTFLTFTTYSRSLWEFPCQFSFDLQEECKVFFIKNIRRMQNTNET